MKKGKAIEGIEYYYATFYDKENDCKVKGFFDTSSMFAMMISEEYRLERYRTETYTSSDVEGLTGIEMNKNLVIINAEDFEK